jgi:glycosyltransferase involved in cell wall biosynthesis
MNPLRIAILNSLLRGGGTDEHCLRLAEELHKLGQQISLVGPPGTEYAPRIAQRQLRLFPTPAKDPGHLKFILNASRVIRREKIQIVHGHHGRDYWPAILAAKLSGTRPKVILTRHLAKSPGSWASRRFVLGQCDALIAVSEATAQILRHGAYEPQSPEAERHVRPPMQGDFSKIHVIYGGVDTERFRPMNAAAQREAFGLRPRDFAFAVVGGYPLPRGKGQREFLLAAARAHDKIPHARFLIIGRGNMKEILETDIQRLGLQGKAWLTPYCQDMPAAMNAIDCLVHPQIGTEAFGLVVCEAHACGKPVIATALDGVPEAFHAGNYGQLVAPESVDELADAMLHWASRPASEASPAALHARVQSQFSLQLSASNVLALYKKLLGIAP